MTFFDLVLMIGGAVGVLGGLWPLLSGRNFPGVLGRGFTRGDNVRLQRAPAVHFRAMGAAIASSGLLILCVGAIIWLSSAPRTELAAVEIVGILSAVASCGSLAWLLVLTYRYKLFRWNEP